jgi:hypothetical protein
LFFAVRAAHCSPRRRRRRLDLDGQEVHVRRQLIVTSGRTPYLAPPKTKTSTRTNELPAVVADSLREHLATFPISPEEIQDETDPHRPAGPPSAFDLHPGRWAPDPPRGLVRTSGGPR